MRSYMCIPQQCFAPVVRDSLQKSLECLKLLFCVPVTIMVGRLLVCIMAGMVPFRTHCGHGGCLYGMAWCWVVLWVAWCQCASWCMGWCCSLARREGGEMVCAQGGSFEPPEGGGGGW